MAKLKNRNKGGKKAHRARSTNRSTQIKNIQEKGRKQFMTMLQQAQEEARKKTLDEAQKEQEKLVIDAPDIGDVGEFQIEEEEKK